METWENTIEFWKNMCKGTLLPECSTSTNDIFKVKFDFNPHTGIWWDNTMQNAGLFYRTVKHFLLQCDLDLNISHHDFFTALLRPYLVHKGGVLDHIYCGGSEFTPPNSEPPLGRSRGPGRRTLPIADHLVLPLALEALGQAGNGSPGREPQRSRSCNPPLGALHV